MATNTANGFTFVEVILSLLVFSTLLALLSPIFPMLHLENEYDELNVRQFFTFIETEVNISNEVIITSNLLVFSSPDGEAITFETYGNSIRRQVNGSGHELLINGVNAIHYTDMGRWFTCRIETEEGKHYEAAFSKS
ncbi:competence type IV pilus minor pilin ComGF [Thalassobacillus hwangdonensis]|uniref:Competence type IV pilus minor pilin ComGF n=1 Tax=Thalassobacillus hwangdonensis TaxID=546108 RepID=A0ABW3KYJ1_9BACI